MSCHIRINKYSASSLRVADNLVYNRQILVTILRGCINREDRKLKTKETKSLNNDDLRQSTEADKKKNIKSFYKSDVCRAINNNYC